MCSMTYVSHVFNIIGDVLSGVCFVGVLDDSSLLYLIIIPSLVYLLIGIVFLVLGFAYLIQVRTIMKRDGTRTDKLERLMMRIGESSTADIARISVGF